MYESFKLTRLCCESKLTKLLPHTALNFLSKSLLSGSGLVRWHSEHTSDFWTYEGAFYFLKSFSSRKQCRQLSSKSVLHLKSSLCCANCKFPIEPSNCFLRLSSIPNLNHGSSQLCFYWCKFTLYFPLSTPYFNVINGSTCKV